MNKIPAIVAIGLMCVACTPTSEGTSVNVAEVKPHLEKIAESRILLGHQSVGRDVISGLKALATRAGVSLRVAEFDGSHVDAAEGLFHHQIGTNGDPDSKCEAFASLLLSPGAQAFDAAMMKFCYLDLKEGTPLNADELLDRYDSMVQQIRAARPDVRIVHVTLPLRSDPLNWKTPIKRVLGRSTDEDAANVLRNEFNDGLRAKYDGEAMFDLAAIQSTLPDGSRSAFSHGGRTIYTLAREYTHDGGHLNDLGREQVAAAFSLAVAEALATPPSYTSGETH